MGTSDEIKRKLDQLVAKGRQVSELAGEMVLASDESTSFMPPPEQK